MTPRERDEDVVALVVLRPASGRELSSAITAETLPEFLPDPRDADTVARELTEAGFTVGGLVGIAMSLQGPRDLFERYFGAPVHEAAEGGWATAGEARELPLDSVPEPVASRVHAITFEPPAETVVTP